jgi:hypothetical protein
MDRMPYMIDIPLSNESSYMHELTSHFNITVTNYLVSALVTKVCFSHIRKTISFGKSVIMLKCNTIHVLMFKMKMPK